MKPSIRKHDDCWVLTRPPYGFSRTPQVTVHESWKAARAELLGRAPASAGASTERGFYTLGLRGRWGLSAGRGTIRMEDT